MLATDTLETAAYAQGRGGGGCHHMGGGSMGMNSMGGGMGSGMMGGGMGSYPMMQQAYQQQMLQQQAYQQQQQYLQVKSAARANKIEMIKQRLRGRTGQEE